jgi:hypothetical protein
VVGGGGGAFLLRLLLLLLLHLLQKGLALHEKTPVPEPLHRRQLRHRQR